MPAPVEQALSDHEAPAFEADRAEAWLSPARGIAIGVLLGLFAWAVIGLAVWAFVR